MTPFGVYGTLRYPFSIMCNKRKFSQWCYYWVKPAFIHFILVLFDGKGLNVTESCGFQPGNFFIKLRETLPQDKNFNVFYGNWFHFLEHQVMLQKIGIWSVGTIPSNRLRGCDLQSGK